MRITKVTGLAEASIRYTIDIIAVGSEAPDIEATLDAFMDAIEMHAVKAKDYDGMENRFGLKGEVIGMTRKSDKLVKIIWEGKDPLFEGAQEIMMDLIGTMGIMLRMQKKIKDKYRASWRDNHGNKPTFGPPSEVRHVQRHHTAWCDTLHEPLDPCNDFSDDV
jgi:hypothetical protein